MRRFFLCSQNNDSKNYGFYQSVFSDFVAAEFPKTPSPKPARIPPQTPPAGGKSAEVLRIRIPRKLFRKTESAFFRFPRQDCFQKRFEFCTMNTAIFRKGFLNQKYGRREAPSVLNSPQKVLIPKGFSTLHVAPRLPIQIYE